MVGGIKFTEHLGCQMVGLVPPNLLGSRKASVFFPAGVGTSSDAATSLFVAN
jgi:hypothetical protein